MPTFADLELIEPLLRAVADEGYTEPTPIQEQAIPPLLEGRDVLGCAQTGTGKTAAFSLPILQHLHNSPRKGKPVIRALVLTPTRELASQISQSFEVYGKHLKLRHMVMFGGVNQKPQVAGLRRGIDVLVATPGRLLDLHGQGYIDFKNVDFFVLDEADRMLDMGFIHDIRRVLKLLPMKKQNLLFSATMPEPIVQLASGFLDKPIRVEVTPNATTVEKIHQLVMFVGQSDKKRLLRWLLEDSKIESAIVFTRTKHGANRVVKQLDQAGVNAAAIHGNRSQSAREKALAGFKRGDIRVLVATDIASRGIDIDGVSHVINYDLPNIAESYVHRIGRTARAGRDGVAIAFCDTSETGYLRDIERLTGKALDRVEDHEWHDPAAVPGSGHRGTKPAASQQGQRGGRSGGGRGQSSGGQSGGGRRPPRSKGPRRRGSPRR